MPNTLTDTTERTIEQQLEAEGLKPCKACMGKGTTHNHFDCLSCKGTGIEPRHKDYHAQLETPLTFEKADRNPYHFEKVSAPIANSMIVIEAGVFNGTTRKVSVNTFTPEEYDSYQQHNDSRGAKLKARGYVLVGHKTIYKGAGVCMTYQLEEKGNTLQVVYCIITAEANRNYVAKMPPLYVEETLNPVEPASVPVEPAVKPVETAKPVKMVDTAPVYTSTATAPATREKLHDGTYTVVFADGTYRTVKIHTKKDGSTLAGKTVISYLAGSDNENDFEGCAFLDHEKGKANLWNRFKNGTFPSEMVTIMDALYQDPKAAGLAYALKSGKCCVCGRKLTVPASLHNGMGPDCAAKVG